MKYQVYELDMKDIGYDRIVPCKAVIFIKCKGKTFSFSLSYETVQVHDPRPVVDGLVLCTTNDPTTVDTSSLKSKIWKQLGKKGDGMIFLLCLSKPSKEIYDATVRKDDATGEYYAYDLDRVVILQKKSDK
jgi:hypothetical protein